jgi:hypothetical protein
MKMANTMINDFVLKTMEENSATININDFVYAILVGFMERNFNSDGSGNQKKIADDMNARLKMT